MKFEYKYLVPIELLSELRTLISPFMEKDSYMEMGVPSGYTVRSIYFDNSQYNDYHEKINGLKVRKKIRIRGYNEHIHKNIVYLEIKRKNNKLIYKQRAPVEYKNLRKLFNTSDTERYILTDNGFKNAIENSQRFFFHIHKNSLLPVVLAIYEREAYFGKFNHLLRVTFDKNIRSSIQPDIHELFCEENITYSITNHFILEVKFGGIFPSWLSSIIGSLGLKLQAFSKYTTCLDEHNVVNNNSRKLFHNFIRTVHL